jgi:hypothetical protein
MRTSFSGQRKECLWMTWLKDRWCLGLLLLLLLPIASHLSAQDATDWLGGYGSAKIRAFLRDPAQNEENHVAAVEVEVQNIWLNYPNESVEPGVQVGVLQYQIDHCPPILTTETVASIPLPSAY